MRTYRIHFTVIVGVLLNHLRSRGHRASLPVNICSLCLLRTQTFHICVCMYIYTYIYIYIHFFMASPTAYGSSQARGRVAAAAAGQQPHPQQYIQAISATYTTAHSNARSLAHWWEPGIEPKPSWILVRFLTTEPQCECLFMYFLIYWHEIHTT